MSPPRHSPAILPFSTILHGQPCHIRSVAFLHQQHRREGIPDPGCIPSRNTRRAEHNHTLSAVSIAGDVDLGRVSIPPSTTVISAFGQTWLFCRPLSVSAGCRLSRSWPPSSTGGSGEEARHEDGEISIPAACRSCIDAYPHHRLELSTVQSAVA